MIHTAAIISIAEKVTPKIYQVNVEGTKNVIRLCRQHQVRRLVYVSSVHAIPEVADRATLVEVSSFSKELVEGAYAVTKAEASQAVLEAAQAGLDAVIVHPSGIIGPYDKGNNHVVQLIQLSLAKKLPAGVKGGYDFVDVRDVAEGCLLAAEKGQAGHCYILSNRYFTVGELLSYVQRVEGGRKIPCLPMGLAKLFAPLFAWLAKLRHTRPLYTKYALYTLSGYCHFSHDKATSELGYRPRDMQDTVRDTIAWLRG